MKNIIKISLVSLLMTFFSSQINAQIDPIDTTKVSWDWYHVVKHNGVEYVAQIISDDGREVLIYTRELGKIYIPKSDIKSMKKIDRPEDVVAGEFQGVGPFTTRYFFTTNALPIKKGENYALINLYGPEVHFSVSNSTSVGFMSTWIGSPLALAVKQTFKTPNPKLNFSLGTINGSSGYFNGFRGFAGLTFGNVTYGDRNNNITFSGGFGYFKTGNRNFEKDGYYEYLEYDYPQTIQTSEPARIAALFSLSGIKKVGSKASFVFDVIYSYGTYTEQNRSIGTLYYGYYDTNGQYVPGKQYMTITNEKNNRKYLIIMPGLRFQKTDKEAFQFSVAGVTVFDNDIFGNNNSLTFPVPTCSWFYKF